MLNHVTSQFDAASLQFTHQTLIMISCRVFNACSAGVSWRSCRRPPHEYQTLPVHGSASLPSRLPRLPCRSALPVRAGGGASRKVQKVGEMLFYVYFVHNVSMINHFRCFQTSSIKTHQLHQTRLPGAVPLPLATADGGVGGASESERGDGERQRRRSVTLHCSEVSCSSTLRRERDSLLSVDCH